MLRYLLNGLDTSEREKLLEEFRRLRTTPRVPQPDGSVKDMAFNWDGQVVSPADVKLPPVI